MPQLPTHAAFAEQIGTDFTLATPAGALALVLLRADAHQAPAGYESFTLLFRGSGERYLPQAIYHLEHAALGALDLFIVPVRQDAQGLYYEAVFNMVAN